MPKKENQQELWKEILFGILWTSAIYLLTQFLNALLVIREAVGEGAVPVLLWGSAGISALIGVLIAGRNRKNERLIFGAGCAVGFVALLLLAAMAGGSNPIARGGQLAGTVLAAVGGGILGGMAGGFPGKNRKKRKGRRR